MSAPKGELVSEAISVHVPEPAGETPNDTRVAPPLVLAVSPTVPERTAPGSASVTPGPVESTVTMTTAVVWTLPAASVTIARISASPSGAEVESQLAVYGAEVSLPTAVNEPAPNAFTSNATETTPDPLSAPAAVSCTAGPPTIAPGLGAVIEPVGCVLSSRVVRAPLVPGLPPTSVARARRS